MQSHVMNGPIEKSEVLPVLAEELALDTVREPVGAVRVRIVADTTPQSLQGEERAEQTDVQRVPRDVEVDAVREPWIEGDTLVVPVYAERIELRRRLFLTEEVRIAQHARSRAVSLQGTVRRERAVIERRQPDGRWREIEPGAASDMAMPNPSPPERKEP
jgi:stress response protein YsnF